jgi:hypothetical protein
MGYLMDVFIDIDRNIDTNNVDYEIDNINTISILLILNIKNYIFENGRHYHKFYEGYYHFPNNDPEQEKKIIIYIIILYLYNQFYFVFIKINLQIILDINTRIGIWTINNRFNF